MTEISETVVAEPLSAPEPPHSEHATAGLLLRQARERAGLHLGALSVALKVSVRQLVALEADDHALSSPVFVRALAGSVCRHLKIDAAPVLALLPQPNLRLHEMPPRLEPVSPQLRHRPSGRVFSLSRKFLFLIVFLLAMIGLVVGLPEWPLEFQAHDTTTPPPAGVASAPVTAPDPLVVLLPSETAMDPAPGSAVSGAKPAAPEASPAVPGVGAALEVVFKGRGDDAWVEVRERTGAVVFSQLVKSGETHVVKGLPVLTVVVGLSDAVEVQVRGQSLDLTPFSRGAVARFEVK